MIIIAAVFVWFAIAMTVYVGAPVVVGASVVVTIAV
jgi:hypothetical protein